MWYFYKIGGILENLPKHLLRGIAGAVLFFYTWADLRPWTVATAMAQQTDAPPNTTVAKPPAARFEEAVREGKQAVVQLDMLLTEGGDFAQTIAAVNEKRGLIEAVDGEVRTEFTQVQQRLVSANLPQEILDRHQQTVAEYDTNFTTLKQNLQAIKQLDQERKDAEGRNDQTEAQAKRAQLHQKVKDTKTRLQDKVKEPPHTPVDPNNLPNRPAKATEKKPRLKKEEFAELQKPIQLAFNSVLSPLMVVAAPDQPTTEDLAPNQDVQITSAIQALAAELERNPVKIYNWVYNNIEFIPSYGSVQGSRMTLEAKRGNAFDIASLLIALLRASGVPSRYAIGTVEIPANKVMNWLGGVATPQMAQRLLGQGGIPNVGVIQGEQISHIRVEHVWVEAWVDYVPGRGAKHREGDTWVPMDASFKQHEFMAPSNLLKDVLFDLQTLSSQLLASANVDGSLGRITGLNENLILAAMDQYAEQAGTYSSSHSLTPTLETLVGKRSVITKVNDVVAGTLPYKVNVRGGSTATLSAELRHYVTLRGFDSTFARSSGTPTFTYRVSLPELNSRRLGVTYIPATEADAVTLQNFRTNGASSLPVYLIKVKPVITLDGEAVATGSSIGMGGRQPIDVVLEGPGTPERISYEVTCGDEVVFGITGNGIMETVVQARFAAVPANTAAENLHQVALHYWMESDFFAGLTAQALGIYAQRQLSVGLFASPLSVSYLFGTPRSGVYQSRFMDVKRSIAALVGAKASDEIAYLKAVGIQQSFLEGDVLDQLFHDGYRSGISAIHLIADANNAGMPIYHVTSQNVSSVLPLLSVSAAIKADISSAANSGKTILVSGAEVNRGVWEGVGYIIQDETTGAGAYVISGGLNGGAIIDCLAELLPSVDTIIGIVALILLAYLLLLAIAWALGAATVPALIAAIVALLAVINATSAAASKRGVLRRSNQANPCCPKPPPEYCTHHTTHTHWPCDGISYPKEHWHYFVYNQDANCVNHPSGELSLNTPQMCGDLPDPCPPYPPP